MRDIIGGENNRPVQPLNEREVNEDKELLRPSENKKAPGNGCFFNHINQAFLLPNAAFTNALNKGWPLRGLEVNSGWN